MTELHACVNSECGKTFPRAVNFCPYCGVRQQGTAAPPAAARAPDLAQDIAPAGRQAAERAAADMAAAERVAAYRAAAGRASAGRAAQERETAQATADAAAPPAAAPAQESSAPRAARPPVREPVGKGTWVVVALLLLAIWLMVRPENRTKKFEGRVAEAIAQAGGCRIGDARAGLAELKTAKASAEQLQRVQQAINDAAPACDKARQRAKAWTELQPVLNGALKSNAPDRAATRLKAFTAKWGEDAETDALFARIDTMRAENLLDEARSCIAQRKRACAEAKIQAAEKLNRPEAAPRLQALREDLSRLLETTLLDETPAPAQ
ncbi:hypothetical protein [Massilia endophytica]|uniref:hypothetical protein n=1 Tax=Massilia endophytica TaxID=2899220 RepID=UPI001E648390|nr:hypothetical protein [Massilia endophytica]UGQ45394.1 hypothetical protein LSQ66_16575 [Massilia endophytica]